jgi:hypothetical protein
MKGKGYVISRRRQIGLAVLAGGLLLAPDAPAIFPIGAFDPYGVLHLRTHRVNDFDANNDGQVGEDEGIPVLLEGGKSGFTEDELEIVRESFAVWERVPQSYASVEVEGVFQDPTISGAQDSFDLQNTIVMQVTSTVDMDGDGLPDENIEPDPAEIIQAVDPTILGFNVAAFVVEDNVVIETPGGESYIVSSGSIVDNDVVIIADNVRPSTLGEEPLGELLAVMVHEMGHFYGMGHTPLNNLTVSDGDLIESTAMVHSIAGVRNRIGATPTMFPFLFQVALEGGGFADGASDLAPDDISNISWLYPRGSQDLFFGLDGEARTRTRPGTGIPSIAVPSAHVVAWADVDNDETTPRVPLFSTFTAYFEHPEDTLNDGKFELINLWKTMETESGLFNATYTLSMTPFNGGGFERQAPPGFTVSEFDYIGGRVGGFTSYSSEVLHEAGNIIDVSNKDAGTPFVWDFELRTLVSVDTGRTIESIVGDNPTFGDPNDVCILNVVSSAAAGVGAASLDSAARGAQSVRSLRDSVLLETPLGSFIVDTYYKLSPTLARFLLGNGLALGATVNAVKLAYWAQENVAMVVGIIAALSILVFGLRRRKRLAASAAGVVLAGLIFTPGAQALLAYQSTEQLVAGATDIVSGRVTSAQARWDGDTSYIYTDIVIEIDDKAKGTLNKQSSMTISQVGGRVGGLKVESSELPSFNAGEEVVLYLYEIEGRGFVVYNGIGGKKVISTDTKTQKKYVTTPDDIKAAKAAKLAPGETVPDKMEVSEFMAELRAIAQAQEKAKSE